MFELSFAVLYLSFPKTQGFVDDDNPSFVPIKALKLSIEHCIARPWHLRRDISVRAERAL